MPVTALYPHSRRINYILWPIFISGGKTMGLKDLFRKLFGGKIFKKKHVRLGIYGPPNAGKTTLANRILVDWGLEEEMGPISEIPHETRHAMEKQNVQIGHDNKSMKIDIIDTPGVATKVDFHEFVESYGMDEDSGKRRAREATEGIIEAIKWLDEVEGVLLVMDASVDPYNQINITLIGNLEARSIPILIVANKIDLEDASGTALKDAFPQHPVVPVSAMNGLNMDKLYRGMIKHFR